MTYFQRALKLNPQYTSAWTLMGHEFMERKNTSAAIEAYRKAIGKLLCKDEVLFASCNIIIMNFFGTFTCKKLYNPENTYCSRWLCCRLKWKSCKNGFKLLVCGQAHLYALDWGWWFGLRPGWVIVLFSWARHLTFAVPLSTFMVGLGMGTKKIF